MFVLSIVFFGRAVAGVGVANVLVKLNNTLLYVLARGGSSLTSSTFAKGLLYLLDSVTCTVCLVTDGQVLGRMKIVAVLQCAFSNTTFSTVVISKFAKFRTALFAFPVR